MKTLICAGMLVVGLLWLGGCSTSKHQSSGHCRKCECAGMAASASDPHRCQKCGHADADHPTSASSHQH